MTGHMKHRHLKSPHPAHRPLLDQQVISDWVELDIESVFFEERTVPNHHGGVGVKTHPASVAALNFRRVHHVVEVPVREQQPIDFVICKIGVGPLWSIEEQVSSGRF